MLLRNPPGSRAPAYGGGLYLRGRHFSPDELELVKTIVAKTYNLGRTQASLEICRKLTWFQPNGWPKDRACREVLRILEEQGMLILPPPKSSSHGNLTRLRRTYPAQPIGADIISCLDLRQIRLEQIKGSDKESLWNELVATHHYIGHSVLVGRTLKYLFYYGSIVVAACALSDGVWSVSARDNLLGALGLDKATIRLQVINNSRFLILPWVQVPNLASYLLSQLTRRGVRDWFDYYHVHPLAFETFVDPGRFAGTCYRAANWIYIGKTSGYRKCGRTHVNSQTAKAVFLYPANPTLRLRLRRELQDQACHT